jgi:RNA polymerase sigma factor (sigma-70 family)
MAWQDMFAGSTARIDAEYEQELHLADQARLGADWALGALIARYQPTVTRYLTRLTGNPPHAQQLSEQIFLRMERRLHGPHGGQHLRLWLLRACTESGLDELRRPNRTAPHAQLATPKPRVLLPELGNSTDRIRSGLEALADKTGSTRRQLRQMIWADQPEIQSAQHRSDGAAHGRPSLWDDVDVPSYEGEEVLPPHEALRYRLIRAVLAELPYGDAQCLALHLVANLNQAEVARALGITASATRRRIVEGLQLFAQRYEAATASLGIAIGTLDGEQTEDMDDMSERLEAPAGSREDEPSFPAQREPIVVSARLDTRPPLEIGEESTVIWDLPPFDDLVDAATTQPVAPGDIAEAGEPYFDSTASLEAAGPEPKYAEDERAEEVTRRLIWSRPVAHRHTPVGSGDDVTIRLPRRPVSRQTQPPDVGAKENKEEQPAAEVETMTEPPPAALVVDADEPSVPMADTPSAPRTVPILTTADVTSSGNGGRLVSLSSGMPRGEPREISVLTTDSSMSPAPDELYSDSADQYQSS